MLALVCSITALLLPTPPVAGPSAGPLAAPATTRRAALQTAAAAAAAFGLSGAAVAEIDATAPPSKMGGLLEPYIDTQRGFKLYKPSGWNQFDADPGVYDIKFQDIIEQETTVTVSSTPVQTATSVTAIGELDAVGEKFAKSRNAKLVAAKSRETDGSLLYILELEGEMYHEYLGLVINRGKLFRVNCVTSNKKWAKRGELYKNIMLSFVPKGF